MTSQIKSRADEERIKETGRSIADEAGARVADVAGAVRTTVNEASDRLPEAIDTVRTGALDGARTIQEMPDPTQRISQRSRWDSGSACRSPVHPDWSSSRRSLPPCSSPRRS